MLPIGTKVKVMIPLAEQTVSDVMKQFNGTITEVVDYRYYRSKKSTAFYTYLLKDCESRYGNKYEFCQEWLIPLESEEVL